jgi:hypothetical protein
LQLPHRLTAITPTLVADEYDNPVPRPDYGPNAARRTIWGLMQPGRSSEPTEPARQPVVTWRLFTTKPIGARERIEWRNVVFEITGEPARWSPRFGHTHYEARLTHVQG